MLRIASAAAIAGTDSLVGPHLSISIITSSPLPICITSGLTPKVCVYLSGSRSNSSALASAEPSEYSSVDASLETLLGTDSLGGGCQVDRDAVNSKRTRSGWGSIQLDIENSVEYFY